MRGREGGREAGRQRSIEALARERAFWKNKGESRGRGGDEGVARP